MKKIFISAAEPSGDIIAAEVMAQCPKNTQFIGIGGEEMAKHGLSSFFDMSELSIMGFTQVIPKAFSILKRINQTVDYIMTEKPDIILTVDAYSFHCRLAKKLRQRGYQGRIVQYVPPAVWAWKASRAQTMARYYDHVYCIFPFEPAYFEKYGLKSTFVGHPATYRLMPPDLIFRERFGLTKTDTIITILPGSRTQEIQVLLPIYLEAAQKILKEIPQAKFFIPTFQHFEKSVTEMCGAKGIKVHLLTASSDKYACFHESALAIAASGTVALELASYGVPAIIGYVTSRLNVWVARRFATVKYICTVNILRDRAVIPELIQEDCTPENITAQALSLLKDPANKMKAEMAEAISLLRSPTGKLPQEIVAQDILQSIR